MTTRAQRGFTLLELLVAITIFAVMAVLAYGGLKTVLDSRKQTDAQAQRLAAVQLAFLQLERDVEQMAPRGIRDEFGDSQPPLRATAGSDAVIEFTHAGWSNPAFAVRSRLQRVAYSTRNQQLLRGYWLVLDRAQDSKPVQNVALDQVNGMEWRFMDADGNWHDQWPAPPGTGQPQTVTPLPRAAEITLDLPDLGKITRLFRVPIGRPLVAGQQNPPGNP